MAEEESVIGRFKAWAGRWGKRVGTALSTTTGIVDGVTKFAPTCEDEVVVEVIGQPGSDKQYLYFLALAAANGVVRKFAKDILTVPPTPAVLMIEYDAADHWVRCTLRYNTSTLLVSDHYPGGVTENQFFDRAAVYRGPPCHVVGGQFGFTSEELPGIPKPSGSPGEFFPDLPFRGQMILTSCPTAERPDPYPVTNKHTEAVPLDKPGVNVVPSTNPRPPGDNRSRGVIVAPVDGTGVSTSPSTPPTSQTDGGSTGYTKGGIKKCCPKGEVLAGLVFSALSNPGGYSGMTFTPPRAGPGGS